MSKHNKKQKKGHLFAHIIIFILLLIVLTVLVCTIYITSRLKNIQNLTLSNTETNQLSDGNMADYTTIAFFGVDSRANALTENTRSDSIILVTINNRNHKISLTSIYRDTYVYIDGHGYTKINHAYSYGGPQLAINTINKNFDLNVQDFVTVNFSALSNIIDDLGGVTIKINKDELDWTNAYAKDVAKINGEKFTKIKHAGKQTLTGVQATGYCRVRYTSGGDFTRASRQRKVVKAIFKKLKSASPLKLIKIFNDMVPQVYTSFTTNEIISLGKFLPFYDIESQKGFPYKLDCHRGVDGIYYDYPTTLSTNVTKLHNKIYKTKNYTPSSRVMEINNSMQ